MKKILFPVTNRVHLARQQLLLKELEKFFEVKIVEYKPEYGDMSEKIVDYAHQFNNVFKAEKPNAVLIRGDRYEMLPIAMCAAYQGIKIIHIEGGDLSGVIDNKVRHAITKLADIHFATNKESYTRLITMGVDSDNVFNFGSLDVEYAASIQTKRLIQEKYFVIAFHPIKNEDGKIFEKLKIDGLKKIDIESNKDYGIGYSGETYSSEDYINLLKYADLLIGNSSSLIKEASILAVPAIDIGERQNNRLKPHNVLHIPYNKEFLDKAIEYHSGLI